MLRSSLIESFDLLSSSRDSRPIGRTDYENACENFYSHFEYLSFRKKSDVVEKILERCELEQVEILWTILQPVSHRDYHYHGICEFPDFNFFKLSTPITRKNKRLGREDSAFIRIKQDAIRINEKYELNQQPLKITPTSNPCLFSDEIKKVQFESHLKKLNISNDHILHHNQPNRIKKIAELKLPAIEGGCDRVVKPVKSILNKHSSEHNAHVISIHEFDTFVKNLIKLFTFEWNDFKRNMFLKQLIEVLDPRHHYLLLTRLMLRKYRDFIGLLPEDISIKILMKLNMKDLESASLVSREWNRLAKSDKLWKSKCERVIHDLAYYSIQANLTDWRKLFEQRDMLKMNWTAGKYKIIEFTGHHKRVLCLTIEGNRLATGSLDKTIKIWDLFSASLKLTLHGHLKGVWCLKFITQYLLCSGSYDSTIKIWNLKNASCSRTLFSHTGPVWAFCKQDNILVSASQDKTAKIWDISSCDLLFNLASHKEAVFCVDMYSDLIVTGSADRTAKLWNRNDGRCLKTILVDENSSVISLSIDRNYLACCSNQILTIWSLEKTDHKYFVRKVQEYKEHYRRIESVRLRMTDSHHGEGLAASVSQDGYIKYWNIKKYKSLHTFDVHNKKRINCVYFDEFRIASASNDNTIKILNFYFEKKN